MPFSLHPFKDLDWRPVPLILCLMGISLDVISATTVESSSDPFLTYYVKSQLLRFLIGITVYISLLFFDYRKLKNYSVLFYLAIVFLLIGLYLTPSLSGVRRWYRIGSVTLQPSEYAKLALVIVLSAFLEREQGSRRPIRTLLIAMGLVLLPFLLILQEPDLGTAFILLPIALVMFYFGGVHPPFVRAFSYLALIPCAFVFLVFSGLMPYEALKPLATKVIKPYQFERLNPNTYHQRAAKTAISLGHLTGSEWQDPYYTLHRLLPEAHTDSIFPAFTEKYGLVGAWSLIALFVGLIYFSFQVASVASDFFGQLLSAGIATYFAIHVVVNLGMMCGLLPITGVPLLLVSYGGSSVLAAMTALGLLQSIYIRRYQF